MTRTKKYLALILTLLVVLFLFITCELRFGQIFYQGDTPNKRIEPLKDYTLEQFPSESSSSPPLYRVKAMIITDLQIGDKTAFIPEEAFYQSVIEKEPDMILVLGDIAHHGKESEYQEYKAFIDDIPTHLPNGQKIPVYCALGNHDLYSSGWELYKKYTTPDSNFYRLKTRNVSWYFVDSGGGTLGKTQLSFLKKEFQQDPNYKFVFTHYPFYGDEDLTYFSLGNIRERAFLLDLCAKSNVKAIYSGHFHDGGYHDFGPFYEKVVTSLCKKPSKKSGWIMLDVNLVANTYTREEYQWTTGDQYITIAIKNYKLD